MAPERVEALREADEVAGDQPRALVDQLVEAVLPVRARLAPEDRRPCRRRPASSRAGRSSRSTPSSAAGGRRESARGTGRRAARRRSARRRSPCTRRRAGPSATGRFSASGAVRKCSSIAWKPASSSPNAAGPDREHRREPDRRVHRVAAADPVPEAERVRRVDAERGHRLEVGRDRRRSAARPRPRPPPSAVEQPLVARSAAFVIVSSVVNVFEQTTNSVSRGVEVARRLDEVGAVDVRDEAEREVATAVVAEGAVGHHGAEVGAADADVDDVADRLARVTPSTRPSAPRRRTPPSGRAPRAPRRPRRRRRRRASGRAACAARRAAPGGPR